MRSVNMSLQHIPGHVPATFSCVCKCCDFVLATCSRHTSAAKCSATRPLLHVASVCTTHVFVAATCPCKMALASGHLKSKIVQSFVHFVIYEHDWCFSSSLFARAAGECRLRTYKISLVMFLKLITFSKLMHERRRVQFKNLQNITRDVFQVLKIARAAAAVSKIRPWLIFLRKYDFSHKLGFRSPYQDNHENEFHLMKNSNWIFLGLIEVRSARHKLRACRNWKNSTCCRRS